MESVRAFMILGAYSTGTNRDARVGSASTNASWTVDNDKDMMFLRNILLNKVFDIGTEIVLSQWT